jgi:hypothetical protein
MGSLASSGCPVRCCTVKGALYTMGQVFASLDSNDPRLTFSGKLDL